MLKVSAIAIALAAVPMSGAAVAQAQAQQAITLSQDERSALLPVQTAVVAKDWAAAQAALAAVAGSATSPGARYTIGRFQLEIGLGLGDVAMQAQGIDTLIASGLVPAADLPALYRNQAVLANDAGNKVKAEAGFTKVVELSPADSEALVNLAQVKVDLKKPEDAVQLLSRAIAVKRAAGQPVDESWYKYALKIAYGGRASPVLRAAAVKLSDELVAAYPTRDNRRDALLIFRDTAGLDPAAELDLMRFMRASGTLAGERDWYDLADGLYKAGSYAEARAVLTDGAAGRMIDPGKAAFAELIRLTDARLTGDRASLASEEAAALEAGNGVMALKIGDALYGYGEQAKAIALYRAALRKGGVDPNVVNTRLAMALLAAGDRPAAEALFKSLSGTRARLGAFWLTWLPKGGG